jgi:hypothetical protein
MKNAKNVKIEKTANAEVKKSDINSLSAILEAQKNKINFEEKEKNSTSTKDKNFIYKFQLLDNKLTEKESKKLRSKMRRNLSNIINEIIIDNRKETNLKNVSKFIEFYKENYIVNDFTVKSITNSSEENKKSEIEFVLTLCKIYLEQK